MSRIQTIKKTDVTNSSNVHGYAVPDGVRVYVIGDIQGYLPALQELHDMINQDIKAHPIEHVHVVYLGDYVAKGDFSAQVLDFLGPGSSAPLVNDQGTIEVTYLIGNHEVAVDRFMQGKGKADQWLFDGGDSLVKRAKSIFDSYDIRVPKTKKEIITNLDEIRQEFNGVVQERGHDEFFRKLELKKSFSDYFFVHAGVDPRYPLWMQRQKTLLHIRDPFLNSAKNFGVRVVTGHTPTPHNKVLFSASQVNVDTGSHKTGVLSCAIFEGTGERVLQAFVPLHKAKMQAKKMKII